MSGSWGGGYVTDIDYLRQYYLVQSPHNLAVACLLNGVRVDPPWENRGLHYLELGCGRGLNVCVLAAANPGWRVTGIDFSPAAIADARRLAAEAGIDNAVFIEADLAAFPETPECAALPPADVISAHGVWSWVAPPVREGIIRLAAARLRAGGLMHLSYNALPAQASLLVVQRLLRETGTQLAGRSDRQVKAGIEVVAALQAAGARQVGATDAARQLIESLPQRDLAYLSHEYMNASWEPCWHADVARALAAAKLDYACTARMMESFPDLMLTPEQRAIHARFDDPMQRELILDSCLNRTLRHDIYVRGATRLSNAARDAALGRIRLALAVPPEEFRYVLRLPAGDATLAEASYRPMVEALAAGPRAIAELIALRGPDAPRLAPAEVAMALAGTHQAMIVADAGAGPSPRTHRFNAVLARNDVSLDNLNASSALASERLGSGIQARGAEILLVAEMARVGAVPDPASLAAALLPGAPPDVRSELAGILAAVLRDRLAVWQRLGVV